MRRKVVRTYQRSLACPLNAVESEEERWHSSSNTLILLSVLLQALEDERNNML
jgi:hypothetical protein